MESLVTVDEAKLQEAFGFNESAFADLSDAFDFSSVFRSAGNSIDLSGMVDLGNIEVDLPDMPSMSLGDLLGNLDLNVSSDGFAQMASSLMEGYQKYAQDHPEADYSGLAEAFQDYLGSDAAQSILRDNIADIIQSGAGISVTTEQLREMLSEIMAGFARYIEENHYDDPSKFGEYLQEYLGTSGAQDILNKWADEIFSGVADNITITSEQISKLAGELAAGYQQYAQQTGAPDPTQMGEHFIEYLGTEDGQKRLSDGLAGVVDTAGIEEQLTGAVESYMGSAMASYGTAVGQILESQISSAMQQMMSQLASGMSEAMGQAMAQVGSSLENAVNIDGEAFADAFRMNMTGDELAELMMSMNSGQSASYESNLTSLGYVDFNVPSGSIFIRKILRARKR